MKKYLFLILLTAALFSAMLFAEAEKAEEKIVQKQSEPHSGAVTAGRTVIEAGGPENVMGALDKKVLNEHVRKILPKIRYCYDKMLFKNPEIGGRVVINFIISASGDVSSSKVQRTTMNNMEVETCVAEQIKKIKFPKPKGGGIVIVNYPFVFKNEKNEAFRELSAMKIAKKFPNWRVRTR